MIFFFDGVVHLGTKVDVIFSFVVFLPLLARVTLIMILFSLQLRSLGLSDLDVCFIY